MWISGIVITLPENSDTAEPIRSALEAMPVFTLGEQQGCRLPAVLEAPDGSTTKYWHEWIEALPGVVQVEVALVSFDETDATANDQVTTDHTAIDHTTANPDSPIPPSAGPLPSLNEDACHV